MNLIVTTNRRRLPLISIVFALAGAFAFAGDIQYDYDGAGRLIRAVYDSTVRVEYTYDNAGNLLARTTGGPTFDSIPASMSIDEDAGTQIVNLTGISAGFNLSQPLRIATASDNATLIPNPTVNYTTPNATGSITYDPVGNRSGSAKIAVTLETGGTDENLSTPEDNVTFSRQFTVIVTPVADAPSLTTQNASSVEDAAIPLTGLSAALADMDGSETLTVRISGLPAGATLNGTPQGTATVIPIGNDAYEIGGPNSGDVGTTLATVSVSLAPNDNRDFVLTVTATARETVGGDVATTIQTIQVLVAGGNDSPTAAADSYATNEDSPIAVPQPALGLLENDVDPDTDPALNDVVDISAPTITDFDSVSARGAHVTVNTDGTFVYNPTPSAQLQALKAGAQVADTFHYEVADAQNSRSQGTVTITVTGVNDPPVAGDDDDSGSGGYLHVDADSVLQISSLMLLANDVDADSNETASLIVASLDGGATLGLVQSIAAPGSECDDPIVFTGGTLVGTTADNTGSTGDDTSCGGSLDTVDEWIRYTAVCTGIATASTCNALTPSNFNTTLAVFSSCPGTEIACNDDSAGVCSSVSWLVAGGEVYLLRVSARASAVGAYGLTITCAEGQVVSGGNECDDPIVYSGGTLFGLTADNTGSTGNDTSCGGSLDTVDEWIRYTAVCTGIATASTCNPQTPVDFDTTLAVFSGCPVPGTEIVCNDDDSDLCSVVDWNVTAGVNYFVRVSARARSVGMYGLTISCAAPARASADGSGTLLSSRVNPKNPPIMGKMPMPPQVPREESAARSASTPISFLEYAPNGQFDSLPAGAASTDTFAYTVEDPNGATDVGVVTITIHGVNDAPTFTSTPVLSAIESQAYSYQITAADPDGDALTITATTKPAWLSLTDNGDGTAELTGTPTTGDVGTHTVTLLVEDPSDSADTHSFVVSVSLAPDLFEDDDTFGEANLVEVEAQTPQEHNFHDQGDEDWVVFWAVGDMFYRIDVFDAGAQADVIFELYASDGVTLLRTVNNSGPGDDEVLAFSPAFVTPPQPSSLLFLRLRNVDPAAIGSGTVYKVKVIRQGGASPLGFLTGTFVNAANAPVTGTLTISNGVTVQINKGAYFVALPPGNTYDLTGAATGFGSISFEDVTIVQNQQTVKDFVFTNNPPVADAQTEAATEDVERTITLTGNDGEPDVAQTLTFVLATLPQTGTLAKTAGGAAITLAQLPLTLGGSSLFFRTAVNDVAQQSFEFRVRDSGGGTDTSANATVTINVTAVNDPPVATAQTVTATEDVEQAITFTGGDGDPDVTQTLTFILATLPQSGSLALTSGGAAITASQLPLTLASPNVFFKTFPNSLAQQTFQFRVRDDGGGANISANATVTVNVSAINDPPVANVQTITASEDIEQMITLTGSDSDPEIAQTLTFMLVTLPQSGTLTQTSGGAVITAGQLPFTLSSPNVFFKTAANDIAQQTFLFRVRDDGGGDDTSATTTVTIDVISVNEPPVANAQTVTATEDMEQTITLSGGDGDSDVTQTVTFILATLPQTGTLAQTSGGAVVTSGQLPLALSSPNIFFKTAANDDTQQTFLFRVRDDGGGTTDTSADATVTVDVIPVNDSPVANAQTVTATEDIEQTIALAGSDGDPDVAQTLTFILVTLPQSGTLTQTSGGAAIISDQLPLTLSSPNVFFKTALNDIAQQTFLFRVRDDGGGTTDTSTDATVTIDVTAINDPPVANAQTVNATEDIEQTITLAGSDGDPEVTQTLTFILATLPQTGTLAQSSGGAAITSGQLPLILASPTIFFKTAANDDTQQTFLFRVRDDGGGTTDTSADATVTITVTAINDGPLFTSVPDTSAPELLPYMYFITTADPEEDAVASIAIGPQRSLPDWLNFTDHLDGTATVSGTPTAHEIGSYPIALVATDEHGASSSQQFTVMVTERPSFDVDGDGAADPATDGLLILRYLFGFRGDALAAGVVNEADCYRCDAEDIESILAQAEAAGTLDADDNNEFDALTDGIIILRWLHGVTGDPLISGALAQDCQRCGVSAIETVLTGFTP